MNLNTISGGTVDVSEVAFARDYNEALVHQVVVAYMATGRQGTKAQKTRSQVRGGGAKPWRQKGTGRARAGTIRSPIWRSGGTTFAAVPRDHSQKVNRKMYRGAMQCILSELLRQERMVVADELKISAPKTKELIAKLKELSMDDVLIITNEVDENLYLAARNIPKIDVCDVEAVDPVRLVAHKNVLITVDALKELGEALS